MRRLNLLQEAGVPVVATATAGSRSRLQPQSSSPGLFTQRVAGQLASRSSVNLGRAVATSTSPALSSSVPRILPIPLISVSLIHCTHGGTAVTTTTNGRRRVAATNAQYVLASWLCTRDSGVDVINVGRRFHQGR